MTLYALEVEEIAPPSGQKPIHWRLMTTHDLLSLEQALQVIEWYKWRWWIEQLFATLKKAGLNLEATQERISPSNSQEARFLLDRWRCEHFKWLKEEIIGNYLLRLLLMLSNKNVYFRFHLHYKEQLENSKIPIPVFLYLGLLG